MMDGGTGHLSRHRASIAMLAIAALIGSQIPDFVGALGDSLTKLMVLPALILLAFLLFYSRSVLLLLLFTFRASTDLLFEQSKFAMGGSRIGVGGLVNGFAILIALLLVAEEPKRLTKRIVLVWGPFVAMLLLGTLITPDRGDSVRYFLQLASNGAVFIGSYYVTRDVAHYRTSLWIVFWSSVIPATYAFMQLISGGGHDFDGGLRLNSTFGHPNIFAFYLTLVIAVALYISKSSLFRLSAGKKFFLGVYMLVLLSLLLLTKTRSAWVAVTAVFVGYALFFERRYFVYLVLGGIAALLMPGVGDRVLDVTQSSGSALSSTAQLNSFEWRQHIWESGLSWMTPGHYLTGYGLQSFQAHSPIFFKEGGGTNWGAHSIYVQMLFEIGAAGLAAFLWMWARLYGAIRPLFAVDRLSFFMLMFVSIQYLITAVSDNMFDYLSVNWYLWFILGAGTAYAELSTRRLPTANGSIAS